ncbi:MAG: phage tail sheath subtilisin-like domain-containing protein [Candidatus Reddybacter sp.]
MLTADNASGSDGSGVVAAVAATSLAGGENEPFPLDSPVLITGSRAQAATLDATGDGKGSLPGAMDAIFDQIGAMVVVVRVAEDPTPATQTSNIIGGTDGNGKNTGLKALLDAEAELGVKPRILGVPDFDSDAAVVAELVSIADSLRGFAYAGVSAATKEAAVTYRDSYGSKRLMLIWPEFTAWDTAANDTVNVSASARALGVRAFIDNQTGWHKTLSNVPVNGVTGLSKSVDFNLTDPNTAANYLNENEITTLIRRAGFRFWGSRTCSADPLFAFESAVRSGDILADTIAEAHLWAVDLPMSKTLIKELVEGINAKFRNLKAQGLIVDATAYVDEDLNGSTELAAGKLTISYDYTPVPPLENLILQQSITSKYLVQLVS